MSDKQIQPVRGRDYQITQRSRPRGLWGQVWMALLQPGYFFRTLPLMEDTRTWLWAAVLILALTGISAVRQDQMMNSTGGGGAAVTDFGNGGGDLSGGPKGGFESLPLDGGGGGGGEIPFDPGMIPSIPGAGGTTADVSTTWTTALLASAAIVVGWFILTVILSEVTLFNGRAPSLGQNLQVAIWATIPFALMAGLQLVYYAAGGQPRADGVSGLLTEWNGYNALPNFWQSLILSLTSRLTLFWLWSLILIYIGARNALRGKRWASAIVVVVWAVLLVLVPVISGQVKAPDDGMPDILSPDSGIPGTGEFSADPLSVPGEENLTGELQGRFADRENNSGGGTSSNSSSSEVESESSSDSLTQSDSPQVAVQEVESVKPLAMPVAPPAGG